MKKHLTLIMAVILSMAVISCSDDPTPEPTPTPLPESTVDSKPWPYDQHMDTSVKPGDNFYMYCIGTWWKEFDLKGENFHAFSGHESQEYINKYASRMNSPIRQKFESDAENIDNTTDAAMAAINKALQITQGIETHEQAWQALAEAIKMGYSPLFKLSLVPKSRVLKAYLAKGESYNPEIQSIRVDEDEDDDEDEDEKNINSPRYILSHPERLDDFVLLSQNRTRAIDNPMLSSIAAALGLSEDEVVIDKRFDEYYYKVSGLSVEEIVEHIRYYIMRDACFSSHEKYEDEAQQYGLNGTYEESLSKFQTDHMGYVNSYDFATHLGAETAKAEIKRMCGELIDVFKRRVESLDWMSSTTKSKAIEKLDKMIINVGYPDQWLEEALPQLTGTSLVEDMMQIKSANFAAIKSCVGKTSYDMSFNAGLLTDSDMSLMVDNAYYDPEDNSINILPIYLMEPYYSQEYSDAFNYSTFASTLGHEITHSLDVQGSQFDAYGNNRNWWTVADKMEFAAREQKLIDCFNLLEIMPDELPNTYANGTKTLGENTADLGGFELAYQAYMEKLAREGYNGEQLVKQERKLFQAYAEQWRAKYNSTHALIRLQKDEHSLPKERVNGIVMNVDRWYELFNVKFGDILYLTPERRAHIW